MVAKGANLLPASMAQILSHPTWDLVLLFALVAVGVFYGISAGKRKIISSIIYTYVAFAIIPVIPFDNLAKFVQTKNTFALKAAVFFAIFLLLTFLLGRGGGRAFSASSSWWQIFVLSFVQAGLLIHILLGFLPPDNIKQLAPLTKAFFANPNLHIWWMLGPLVLLVIMRRFEYREESRW